ncbi:MAG: aldolase/citrate lyase family protein [Bilophila wadsworthia]
MIRAIELHSAEAFVRVRDSCAPPCSTRWIRGAGHHHPRRNRWEEARRLVEYAKYYPLGARGFAFSRSAKYGFLPELKQIGDYFTATNQRTILMPQCETAGALEHIEEIAALDGIDGIFVGPYDLSVALGAPARFATRVCRGSAG